MVRMTVKNPHRHRNVIVLPLKVVLVIKSIDLIIQLVFSPYRELE